MIDEYIQTVCDLLKIAAPQIEFNTSHFSSPTMMAQCAPDGTVLYIRKLSVSTPDYLFAIAHELRHVWQLKKNPKLLEGYLPVNLSASIEAYNLQPAEVDANAFAALVMIDFWGIEPLFENMSPCVRSAIFKRARDISR